MLKLQAEVNDMLVWAEITAVPAGCFVSMFLNYEYSVQHNQLLNLVLRPN